MIKYENKINIHTQPWVKGGSKMNMSKELEKIVETVKTRVEREIPDKGYFRNFSENIDAKNNSDFFGSNIALFIERDEEREGRAFLGISVLHPQLKMDATSYLMNGDRETISKYLQNPELKAKLEEKIVKLSEALQKQQ